MPLVREAISSACTNRDPFHLDIGEFRSLPFETFKRLQERAFELARPAIEESFRTGCTHVAVAGGEVVQRQADPGGFAPEQIESLIEEHGKPVYAFSRPDLVEESKWTHVGGTDYYPTVRLWVGHTEWTDSKVFKEGKSLDVDFDTGNPDMTVFDEEGLSGVFKTPPVYAYEMGVHLEKAYHYFSERARLGLKDGHDNLRVITSDIRLVHDWRISPWVLASPLRSGFVGRHLIFGASFRAILDPSARQTELELL
jgi:hypothetical protein